MTTITRYTKPTDWARSAADALGSNARAAEHHANLMAILERKQ